MTAELQCAGHADCRRSSGHQPASGKIRTYKVRARESEAIYDVNLARLECSCPEWKTQRAEFPAGDARRVCAHLYDKLYSTKVERDFDPLLQLFIRYGRRMSSYRVTSDDLGAFLMGQPFGPGVVRVLGDVNGRPILATYNARSREWANGTDGFDLVTLAG